MYNKDEKMKNKIRKQKTAKYKKTIALKAE